LKTIAARINRQLGKKRKYIHISKFRINWFEERKNMKHEKINLSSHIHRNYERSKAKIAKFRR
jgi:hypothetical protein